MKSLSIYYQLDQDVLSHSTSCIVVLFNSVAGLTCRLTFNAVRFSMHATVGYFVRVEFFFSFIVGL